VEVEVYRRRAPLGAAWSVILGRGKSFWGPMLYLEALKRPSAKTLKYVELVLHSETVR
jgi:hypothetical protein